MYCLLNHLHLAYSAQPPLPSANYNAKCLPWIMNVPDSMVRGIVCLTGIWERKGVHRAMAISTGYACSMNVGYVGEKVGSVNP